jgi:hypothetical protein
MSWHAIRWTIMNARGRRIGVSINANFGMTAPAARSIAGILP